jgi:hypothetical protein
MTADDLREMLLRRGLHVESIVAEQEKTFKVTVAPGVVVMFYTDCAPDSVFYEAHSYGLIGRAPNVIEAWLLLWEAAVLKHEVNLYPSGTDRLWKCLNPLAASRHPPPPPTRKK